MDDTAASALFAWRNQELLAAHVSGREPTRWADCILCLSSLDRTGYAPALVAIAHQHFTWGLIQKSQAFALHLLSEANMPWIRQFGLQSGHEVDKLKSIPFTTAVTGSPILPGTIGWMDCRVETELDIGDRTLFVAEVVQSQITCYGPPLSLKHVLEHAPSDIRSDLRQRLHNDSALDSAAIAAWRATQMKERAENE